MFKISKCPNCGSGEIYQHAGGISGGGYAANYLPGLGRFFRHARLYPAICQRCGLTRFFTDEDAREKLSSSPKWVKVKAH